MASRNRSNLLLLVQVSVINCIFCNFGEVAAKHWNELKGSGTPGEHAHYKPTGQEDVALGTRSDLRVLNYRVQTAHVELVVLPLSRRNLGQYMSCYVNCYSTNTPGKVSREKKT